MKRINLNIRFQLPEQEVWEARLISRVVMLLAKLLQLVKSLIEVPYQVVVLVDHMQSPSNN